MATVAMGPAELPACLLCLLLFYDCVTDLTQYCKPEKQPFAYGSINAHYNCYKLAFSGPVIRTQNYLAGWQVAVKSAALMFE